MNRLTGFVAVSVVVGGVGALYQTGAFAHAGATGMVMKRMEMMETMGKSMKEMAGMFRGKKPYDAERVKELASDMASHSEHIPMMFPKGSDKKPSEAKETIWSDPEGFKQSSLELKQYAEALASASTDQAAAKVAFKVVGKTCKSCHTDYREKKN